MLKLKRSDYNITLDDSFPIYWKATDEQLRSAVYDSDAWTDDPDADRHYYILTFDDIRTEFESFTIEERIEYFQPDDPESYTVYDWIRDCMMNSLSVVRSIERTAPYPD